MELQITLRSIVHSTYPHCKIMLISAAAAAAFLGLLPCGLQFGKSAHFRAEREFEEVRKAVCRTFFIIINRTEFCLSLCGIFLSVRSQAS